MQNKSQKNMMYKKLTHFTINFKQARIKTAKFNIEIACFGLKNNQKQNKIRKIFQVVKK